MQQNNQAMGNNMVGNPNLTRISAQEFAGKFKSKRECYNFLAVDCEVYLPPYDNTTIYFVSDLLFDGLTHILNSSKISCVSARPTFQWTKSRLCTSHNIRICPSTRFLLLPRASPGSNFTCPTTLTWRKCRNSGWLTFAQLFSEIISKIGLLIRWRTGMHSWPTKGRS